MTSYASPPGQPTPNRNAALEYGLGRGARQVVEDEVRRRRGLPRGVRIGGVITQVGDEDGSMLVSGEVEIGWNVGCRGGALDAAGDGEQCQVTRCHHTVKSTALGLCGGESPDR